MDSHQDWARFSYQQVPDSCCQMDYDRETVREKKKIIKTFTLDNSLYNFIIKSNQYFCIIITASRVQSLQR